MAKTPSTIAPISVGRITMRPAESQAARPEPTATATENTARNMVTTSSVPPSTVFTSGGRSDSTTAPTSQNQLVTSAPHQIRRSSRRWRRSRAVEETMLTEIFRSGAPEPTFGMSRLDPQHSSANTSMRPANDAGSPPSLAAMPPTMVPSRIAMKVAPSTSALAAGSSDLSSRSGRMPYLIGPNCEPMTPNANSATNSSGTECMAKPMIATIDDADLGKLQPLRHDRLVVAVGDLAAEARKDRKYGRMKTAAAERDQGFGGRAADLEQDQEHQRVLEEIVAERREELAPEQRREAAGQHQRPGRGRRWVGHWVGHRVGHCLSHRLMGTSLCQKRVAETSLGLYDRAHITLIELPKIIGERMS